MCSRKKVNHISICSDELRKIENQPTDDLVIENLKFILTCLENISELGINFHKNEVLVVEASDHEPDMIAHMPNCKRASSLSLTWVSRLAVEPSPQGIVVPYLERWRNMQTHGWGS